MLFCGIYEHNFFAAAKEIHKLGFLSTTKSADTKFPFPQPRNYQKTEKYRG